VATHGLHLLFTADSDNANATVPVDEIDSTDTQFLLPPNEPNVGSAVNQIYTTPIQTVTTLFGGSATAPAPYAAGSGVPNSPVSHRDSPGSSNSKAPDSLLP
jgi:hypothetical protein